MNKNVTNFMKLYMFLKRERPEMDDFEIKKKGKIINRNFIISRNNF